MKTYQVYVDLAEDWSDEHIEVSTEIVEAASPEVAREIIEKRIAEDKLDKSLNGRKTHIWDITEDDEIKKEELL